MLYTIQVCLYYEHLLFLILLYMVLEYTPIKNFNTPTQINNLGFAIHHALKKLC